MDSLDDVRTLAEMVNEISRPQRRQPRIVQAAVLAKKMEQPYGDTYKAVLLFESGEVDAYVIGVPLVAVTAKGRTFHLAAKHDRVYVFTESPNVGEQETNR